MGQLFAHPRMSIPLSPLRRVITEEAERLLPNRPRFWVHYLFSRAVWTREQLLGSFRLRHTDVRRPGRKARAKGVVLVFSPGARNFGWFAVTNWTVTAKDWKAARERERREARRRA